MNEKTVPHVHLRHGFNDSDPTPKAMRPLPGLRRTALVFSPFRLGAKPVNLCWSDCAPLYWQIISGIGELLPEAAFSVVDHERRFALPEDWIEAERLGFSDPDDEPDAPPRCVWTGPDGAAFVDARTEYWRYAGGPAPYSDSWTVSFYSATPELDSAVRDVIVRLCSKARLPVLSEKSERPKPSPPVRRIGPHPYGIYVLSAGAAAAAVFLLFVDSKGPFAARAFVFWFCAIFSVWMLRIALREERALSDPDRADLYGERRDP